MTPWLHQDRATSPAADALGDRDRHRLASAVADPGAAQVPGTRLRDRRRPRRPAQEDEEDLGGRGHRAQVSRGQDGVGRRASPAGGSPPRRDHVPCRPLLPRRRSAPAGASARSAWTLVSRSSPSCTFDPRQRAAATRRAAASTWCRGPTAPSGSPTTTVLQHSCAARSTRRAIRSSPAARPSGGRRRDGPGRSGQPDAHAPGPRRDAQARHGLSARGKPLPGRDSGRPPAPRRCGCRRGRRPARRRPCRPRHRRRAARRAAGSRAR